MCSVEFGNQEMSKSKMNSKSYLDHIGAIVVDGRRHFLGADVDGHLFGRFQRERLVRFADDDRRRHVHDALVLEQVGNLFIARRQQSEDDPIGANWLPTHRPS